MRTSIDKKQIAQLLDKFMAGTTTLDEEQTLAQYFRTQEVEAEWQPYKAMFALFALGHVEVPAVSAPERSRARVISLLWTLGGVAASVILLVGLYWWSIEQKSVPDTRTAVLTSQPSEEYTQPDADPALTDCTPTPKPTRQADAPLAEIITRPAASHQYTHSGMDTGHPDRSQEEPTETSDQQLMAEYIASNFMTLEERNLLSDDWAADVDKALLNHEPDRMDPLNGIGQIVQYDYD